MTAVPYGLLLVDKPKGWTSHDVVAFLRKYFPRKTKVGHTGTLDPMATGLLILLVGKATKLAIEFQGLDKSYSGSLRLGLETETGDLDGEPVRESEVPALEPSRLSSLFEEYRGEVELAIPRFSAVKHKGRPLYHYARKGIETPEKIRKSRIDFWELLRWSPPEASFRVSCSSGTYVRALAMEAGRRLGCGAVLSALRRETVGPYRLEDARTLEELREMGSGDKGALSRLLGSPTSEAVSRV